MTWRVGDCLHPALPDQRPQRPPPVPMLAGEHRFRDASGVKHEAEQAGLNRRGANPLGEGLGPDGGRRVPHVSLGLRRAPKPEQPRQRADDDLAHGMLEVSAGPCEQFEHRRIEQRLRVDDVAHTLETPRIDRARGRDSDHDPDDGLAPERHPDAHARLQERRPFRTRRQVVERVPDRHRQCDL